MVNEQSQPFDEQYQETVLKEVVTLMDRVIADPASMEYCLEHEKFSGWICRNTF